jgi:DNA-binding NarL/FixJ family response regulator
VSVIRTVIADDAQDLRVLIRVTLERDPRFTVVGEAADGEEALSVVDAQRPDLLVLDLAMPRMDGLEVLSHLHERSEPPPVVVLSGFTNDAMIRKAMSLGATAYIPKGRNITDLPDLFAAAVATGDAMGRYVAAYERIDEAVRTLGSNGLERTTPSGWTAKEALAHLAFWEETHVPVVVGMFRGEPLPDGWEHGSGDLGLPAGSPWPAADVHNEREAAWARSRPAAEVVARWRRSHEQALEVFRSLTADESTDPRFTERMAASVSHMDEHLAELRALLDE